MLARVADWVTIGAGAIAFLGVLAAALTRPHLRIYHRIYPDGSAISVTLAHVKGGRPARNCHFGWGALNEADIATSGDEAGARPETADLLPGGSLRVEAFDPTEVHFATVPSDGTWLLELPRPGGVALDFSWERPMAPWARINRAVIWTAQNRANGTEPAILRGRAARKALLEAGVRWRGSHRLRMKRGR